MIPRHYNRDIRTSDVLPINGEVIKDLEDKMCSVCMDEMKEDSEVFMIEKCSHIFH